VPLRPLCLFVSTKQNNIIFSSFGSKEALGLLPSTHTHALSFNEIVTGGLVGVDAVLLHQVLLDHCAKME
jgi:hypothetical protein